MASQSIIGFIGGGQLARMSAHAARALGHRCIFYSNDVDGPCAGLGEFCPGADDDLAAYKSFAQKCSVVTLENEYISSEILFELEKITRVCPSASAFEKIEDKFKEKQFFARCDIPVAPYAAVSSPELDMKAFAEKHSFPFMLKSVKGGYDGFGNYVVGDLPEAMRGFEALGGNRGQAILMEAMQAFVAEVAVTVARNPEGEHVVYPVVDSVQSDAHICTRVIAPSSQPNSVTDLVIQYAVTAMDALAAVGVFSFEFFVLKDGAVVLNESAPRPHNSAHYTMDACETSQFTNHILAITGKALGSTIMKCQSAEMENILGVAEAPRSTSENEFVHWYGKKESRPGRKMGHVNKLRF
ncbi:MAG: 5-(carboxyamino)imidazole ribonucleotide synthase [Bdellovibrionales bacterium]|nr:5-(carboxyamino)imidazole ribonucleotide synthase [Bdellovibrionales bacterium]